ncbi:hypothetical protein MKX03_018117 [Papaver bracteatum]|nr:hypothetical protein MKX03_018117 [Papaver bracteatum]
MEYWQHVISFGVSAATVDWTAELCGYEGEIAKVAVERPSEHVPIPMVSQLSYAEACHLIQDNVDFNHQLRKLTLKETKDIMDLIRFQAQALSRITEKYKELEAELARRPPLMVQDSQNSSQTIIGFGNFSGTTPSQVWNQVGQSQPPTGTLMSNNLVGSSTINSARIPFQPPRFSPSDD